MGTDTLKVIVTGKNIAVTPALRERAEKRAEKVLRFLPGSHPVTVEVVLSVQREEQTAEVTVQIGGLVIRGESRTSDMYASIDASMDRVEKQIRRNKSRLQKRLQQSPKFAEIQTNETTDAVEGEELPRLVRTKRFAVKPMDVEEAIMQMELLGHDFFVFRNAETDDVNVLYRRRDGNYGLIDPDYT